MRRLLLLLAMTMTSAAAYGQVSTIIPAPILAIPSFSTSVMDHDGNLLIFEVSIGLLNTLSPQSLSSKTHVVVVSSDGKTKTGYDYSGYFQVVGVGQNAVYAFMTSVGSSTAAAMRNLVALRVVAGTLPSTLPSVSAGVEAKLSAGTTPGEADRIALIDSSFLPVLAPGTTMPTMSPINVSHTIRLYTSDGTSFVANPNNPISVQ